jgi:hypothetical protein
MEVITRDGHHPCIRHCAECNFYGIFISILGRAFSLLLLTGRKAPLSKTTPKLAVDPRIEVGLFFFFRKNTY